MWTRKYQKGFTLLETLVAFAIAALALTALYNGMLTSLLIGGDAARQAAALAIARSHLATLDPAGAVVPGPREGDEAGLYHWSLSVTPVAAARGGASEAARGTNGPALVLYDARIAVSWRGATGRTRSVALATLRAGDPPPGSR